ncbi:MAG: phytoene dehydrogenase [Flavobacteriales bacterium]|nr:phytoene dehydrogenase [Flavobacteriales bacterium]
MSEKIVVVGSGFSALAAATTLADAGKNVIVLEKNEQTGGRARQFEASGFTFDMGPSWYWMPDVFESYFNRFGKKVSDYFELKRLDPSYRVFFGKDDYLDLPADYNSFKALFEQIEKGSGEKLDEFMNEAQYKYEVGMQDLVHKPGKSILEFAQWRVVSGVFRLQLFQSLSKHVRKFFSNEKLTKLMEFPVLFLGAKPQETPALYSLMNYADVKLGTWYPMGGMHKIVEAMTLLAKEKGVEIILDCEVKKLQAKNEKVVKAITTKGDFEADQFISGADYHHTDKQLLDREFHNYTEEYWDRRKMAPSSLLFYLGVDKKLKNLLHHNLFFDEDFNQHAVEIYDEPQWPSKPLFYVCAPSLTDKSVAPEACENLFILMPVAHNLEDKEEVREKYYHLIMDRLESLTNQEIRSHVIYKKSYAHTDFVNDYHAFKGNAYGLANTLGQTAVLKPSIKNKKLKNLHYTGQLTTPGPGVPPSLISGQVVANEVLKTL